MPANQRRRHLREIEPEKVDFVDRAANKRKFIVFKEDAMADTLGPELEAVSDEELRTAAGGIDLEKATAALSDLTAAVEILKEQLDKDEPVTQEQLAQAEAATAAADEATSEAGAKAEGEGEMNPAEVMAAIGEKAVMWAKELVDGETDPAQVAGYVEELMGMLKPLMAASEGEAEGEQPEEASAEDAPPPPPPRGDQEEKREDPEAPPAVESERTGQVAKSEASFQATVQDVAERALFLSRKAAGVEDKRIRKEAEQLLGLMSSLVEKYASRKEKGFDLPDYNVVIDVDRKLNDIEDVVRKTQEEAKVEEAKAEDGKAETEDKPAAAETPIEEDKAEVPAESAVEAAAEAPKDAEGKESAQTAEEDAADLSKALLDRISALTGQVTELQGFIAKARGTVPSPAADGEPEGTHRSESSGMLFPMDYNDPAYQVDLDAKGEE